MRSRNVLNAIGVVGLSSLSGIAAAVSTTDINNSQPGQTSGIATAYVSATGLSNAASTSGAIGNFALGGGGALGGLDVKRFALRGTGSGAAAAPGGSNWNVWGAISRSNVGYNFAPLQSSGNVDVYLAGVDYTLANNMIVGVALAADRTDIDLNFSGGKLKGNGVTVSPYLGIPINKNLAFDATVGLGRTNVDTNAGGVVGSTRSDRSVGSLGLTYRENIDAWTLTGRGALLTVHDKLGAYTLTNGTFVPSGTVNVTQARFTGQVAYNAGQITPFASLTYIYDISRPDQAPVFGIAAANDRDAWTPAIGIRFKADSSVYGAVQYSTERGRSEVKNDQFLFNLGIRF